MNGSTSFPAVKELFKEAWELFKRSALSLFFLWLFSVAIYLVIIIGAAIIGLVMAGSVGALKLFSASSPPWATLLKPSFVAFAGAYLLAIIVIMTVVGLAMNAATILLVDQADKPEPFGTVMRKSFGFVVPLFIAGLLAGLLSFGGLFVFLLPAIFFSFFFMFFAYEVVLSGKRSLEALRGSVQIVSQNFGEIFVRLLSYFFVYVALAIILPSLLRKIDPSINLVVGGTSFFLNILFGWYGLCYSIALYKEAKTHTNTDKKTSLVWMVVVAVIGWTIFALIMIGVINLLKSPAVQKGIQDLLNKKNTAALAPVKASPLTQYEADNLAEATLTEANAYRETKQYPALTEDGRLCAYAQKRLQELDSLGRYDDRKGFYEDLADAQTTKTYFSDYTTLNESVWVRPDSTSDPKAIVTAWTTGGFAKKDSTIIANPDFSGVCIRANSNWLVIIGGQS